MANKRARVLTPWIGTGASTLDPKRPKVGDDYPLLKLEDVTGLPAQNIPPDPNLAVAQIECTAEVLDAIGADPQYGPILWEEDLV
jgi:hypothetical protein